MVIVMGGVRVMKVSYIELQQYVLTGL